MRHEYHHDTDKTEWGDGPWLTEPDKVVWVDEATNLDCMIHRNQVGALCGYVGVPPTHPWHGLSYSEIEHEGVDVHGTLTFTNKCQETATEEDGICHVPEPGREHDIWWVGFDCAHNNMDIAPGIEKYRITHPVQSLIHDLSEAFTGAGTWANPTYKTVEWVQAEVERLAAQAKEAA